MKLAVGLVAAILTTSLVVGCTSPTSPNEPVPVTTVGQGEDSQIANETTFVIRSNAELLAAWAQIYARNPAATPPQVDFSTSMLVIVAMGRQPSSGFSVRITGATRERDGLVVHVAMGRPGENCGSATVITSPIAIARLPKTDRPVRFDITRTAIPCR